MLIIFMNICLTDCIYDAILCVKDIKDIIMKIGKQDIGLYQITFSMAIIGLIITIAGNFFDVSVAKKLCYLVGALILLAAALLEKNTYYTILETVLSIGAGIAFFPISFMWKSIIPVSLGVLAAAYLGATGKLKDHLTWLSVVGLLVATWGYAVTTHYIYFLAGAIITTYSFLAFRRGERIALAFGILNAVFTLTALLEILGVL